MPGRREPRLGLAIVAAVAACSAPPRPTRHPLDSTASIDAMGERAVRDGTVGLSIVVIRGVRVVHARGYGFEDVDHRAPMTPQSVIPLASITKQIWAVAVMQLVQAKQLQPWTRVRSILPEFPDPGVTVGTLLHHMSGLGDDMPTEDDAHFSDLHFDFPPGTWWQYSNRGSLIVRRIVEAVSAMPWPQYLHDRIAAPANLASLKTCGSHVPLYTKDHAAAGLPDSDMERIEFACSNALDLARFEVALDAGGLIDATWLGEMRMGVSMFMAPEWVRLPYGMFTRIANLDGHRAYGHTGSFPGVSVAAFHFPVDDLTIVVVENTDARAGDRAYEIVTKIARLLLDVPPPRVREHPAPHDELAAIAGTYEASGIGRARVSMRDGAGWIEVLDDHGAVQDEGPLYWLGGRTFAGGPGHVDLDQQLVFVPSTGPAQAILVGHPFVLDAVARRVSP